MGSKQLNEAAARVRFSHACLLHAMTCITICQCNASGHMWEKLVVLSGRSPFSCQKTTVHVRFSNRTTLIEGLNDPSPSAIRAPPSTPQTTLAASGSSTEVVGSKANACTMKNCFAAKRCSRGPLFYVYPGNLTATCSKSTRPKHLWPAQCMLYTIMKEFPTTTDPSEACFFMPGFDTGGALIASKFNVRSIVCA